MATTEEMPPGSSERSPQAVRGWFAAPTVIGMGCQSGDSSITGVVVSGPASLPSAFMTHTSPGAASVSERVNAIMRPSGDQAGPFVVQLVVGQLPHVGAVRVHDEDLAVRAAVAGGLPRDLRPVRRPRRRAVERRVVGQGDDVRAVRAGDVDLLVTAGRDAVVIAAEQQARAIGEKVG